MKVPLIVRHRGLLLALIATMGIIYALAVLTLIAFGSWSRTLIFAVLLTLDVVAYLAVRDYSE